MVGVMCLSIRAVWTGDWALHLPALEEIVKWFFALDKLNYASLISIYLIERSQLERTDPEMWSEISKWKLGVNKTPSPFLPFVPYDEILLWNKSTDG